MKKKIKKREQIRRDLMRRGLTIREFAEKYSLKYETVRSLMTRINLNPERKFRGTVDISILRAIEQETAHLKRRKSHE